MDKEIKKILIISHSMELGGAEVSLLGLLENFDTEKFEVDLFLLRHEGELIPYIPEKINVLPTVPEYTVLARPMIDVFREGHILLGLGRIFGKYFAQHIKRKRKLNGDDGISLEYSHKFTYKLMPKINPDKEYDAVISFLTPHYIAAEKVKARTKIAWIHTDYSKLAIDVDSELRMWEKFDHVIAVSDAARSSFLRVFPVLTGKVISIENILPEKYIRKRSLQNSENQLRRTSDELIFLSIGRFCFAKNFDSVPEICAKLTSQKLNIMWYLIGFGPDEELIRNRISEFHMEEHVKILGKIDNPYPYINKCDFYLQLSRFEGKSVAVREAQFFGKPVIIANYETSKSQLEKDVDGFIVNQSIDRCISEISQIISRQDLVDIVKKNCQSRDYTNRNEIKKLEDLLIE